MGQVTLAEGAAPSTPASGYGTIYVKTDGKFYSKDDAGQEYVISVLGLNLGTEQASTSGTSIDFTGIPASARRITINFAGVSTNGTSHWLIQLGDSEGIEATGYLGSGSVLSASSAATTAYTTGFGIRNDSASSVAHGTIILTCEDATNFTWAASGVTSNSGVTYTLTTSGYKSTSLALDRVRITTVNGTDTFDAGAINITYE